MRPYNLGSFGPAVLGTIAGPLIYGKTIQVAKPGKIPRLVDALRLALFVGWLASSSVVFIFGVQV